MKYGTGTLTVGVPSENLIGVISKDVPSEDLPEEEVIRRALASPIGSPRLGEMVSPGQTVAIIVSDVTRLWQRMSVYLPFVVEELNAAGVADKDIRFISSVGFHRAQTPAEHARLLGEELSARFTMKDHDCRDEKNLVTVGATSRGTPVEINRLAMECDHMVLTGCTSYHPFVGFGGGKKSLLPGIAGFASIQKNHYLVLSDEVGAGQRPEVCNGNIEGNPVHLDIMEATAMVNPSFMINVVMGHSGKIAHAVAGHWDQAHTRAMAMVDDLYGVPISELADLTVASQGGFPKDIEFYQTGKAIYHALDSVKPGGSLIVLSECREGLGPEHARLIFEDFQTTHEREKEVRNLFSVPKYVSYFMCAAADRYDIIVVSSLDPARLARTNIRIVPSVEEAFGIVYQEKGKDLRTYVMPLGSSMLPQLNRGPD
jgi:nickel-dependent lactate racemase